MIRGTLVTVFFVLVLADIEAASGQDFTGTYTFGQAEIDTAIRFAW